METENRNYRTLSSATFYALERQARARRSREMGRLFSALVKKVGTLFHAPHGGNEVFHA